MAAASARSLTSHCSGPAAVASFLRSGRMHDMFTQPRHAARSSAAHRACRAATWTGGRGPLSSSVRHAMDDVQYDGLSD